MTIFLTFIWKYKAWVLAGAIAIAAGIYISYLKIDYNVMAANVVSQKGQIETLTRNNTILEQNAVAVKKQDVELRKIRTAAEKAVRMIAAMPQETVEVLKKDENITLINDCLVDYADDPNGVLPDRCDAVKAYLPKSAAPAPAEGRGEPAK